MSWIESKTPAIQSKMTSPGPHHDDSSREKHLPTLWGPLFCNRTDYREHWSVPPSFPPVTLHTTLGNVKSICNPSPKCRITENMEAHYSISHLCLAAWQALLLVHICCPSIVGAQWSLVGFTNDYDSFCFLHCSDHLVLNTLQFAFFLSKSNLAKSIASYYTLDPANALKCFKPLFQGQCPPWYCVFVFCRWGCGWSQGRVVMSRTSSGEQKCGLPAPG